MRKNGNWIDKSKPLFQQAILSPEPTQANENMDSATKQTLEEAQRITLEQTVEQIIQKKSKKKLNQSQDPHMKNESNDA